MAGLGAALNMRHENVLHRRKFLLYNYYSNRLVLSLIIILAFTFILQNNNNFKVNAIFSNVYQENSIISVVLPHDTYPGFNVKKFPLKATSFTTNTNTSTICHSPLKYRIVENEFSKYFTILNDGMMITTTDLTPLINHPVNLIVIEETPNSSLSYQLHLLVMNKNDMLRFPQSNMDLCGEIKENQLEGTKVQGIPLLQANSARKYDIVNYTIIDGNTDDSFTLKNSLSGNIGNSLLIKNWEAGVWLVTNKPLDREEKSYYDLSIEASDENGRDKTILKITVKIIDVNDNRPLFKNNDYRFTVQGTRTDDLNMNSTFTWERFTIIGKVEAKDADDDKIAYKLLSPSNTVIIVPQTGELMLANEPEKMELIIYVEAHDLRIPSLSSLKPARVLIEFVVPELIPALLQHIDYDLINQHSHRRDKRRVTRAVRPTKRIEFTEADGDTEGKSVFQLEKETDRETFKIRDENPWVTVEPNGAVRVKKKWDYEELGPEKTIDFWVIITNTGHNGKHKIF